ncbi:MAG: protein-export chaperone SecB [Bacteroidales bacterium]|nr:protein-export chaperone SecB [Bacteroidales bacterium]
METNTSSFRLVDFLVERSLIERKPIKLDDRPSIDISPSGYLIRDKSIYQLALDIKVTTESNRFSAEVKAVGIFHFPDDDEATLGNFFYINAPAILFPYVRAYITSLTALSGLGSEIIPTLNLTGLAEELKKNTIEK